MSSASTSLAFGIDIGGSGIKGAPVDVATGEIVRLEVTRTHVEPCLRRCP